MSGPTAKKPALPESILRLWNVSERELSRLILENPSLRGIMLGYVAELKLQQLLERHPQITRTLKHDDHDRKRKSDRVIIYKGMEFSIESKSLQTNSIKRDGDKWVGRAQVDGSDRRMVQFPDGGKLNTTLLLRGQFDILAVNCFAFENEWRFAFALNRDLPASTHKKYRPKHRSMLIASLIEVTWPPSPPFVTDPLPLIAQLHRERRSRQ